MFYNSKKDYYYIAQTGDHAGQEGLMIGRFVDPSYNDITLLFSDGEKRHYNFNYVTFSREEEFKND